MCGDEIVESGWKKVRIQRYQLKRNWLAKVQAVGEKEGAGRRAGPSDKQQELR